ncbi:Protein bfr2 [Penicillium subrubescens]|uniref:Protein BFR2 n=1 Tax=Penicillium subrubescens TaxID=1316194 RepID=A0A1Q5T8W8_9EURO|nr:Protein bfr2 [Penicillium subrubescens]KAJ5912201.1 Protein bfr2 [Penicillium subrubescens]OKO96673.1 Protein bfr2 [Penicillium subrubescens]
MAPSKPRSGRSLADQLADLEDPTPKDFDPEDIDRDEQSSDDEGAGKESDLNAGREHYQSVGKGKLRKQEPVDLGKQYAGARVSRDDLDADSDDDPFAARTDDELTSDQEDDGDSASAESQSDEDLVSGSEEEQSDDDESDRMDDENDHDHLSGSEVPEVDRPRRKQNKTHNGIGHLSDMHDDSGRKQGHSDDRDELRRLMASDQKTIAATISQAAKADAAKGKAVKEQRTTFDALLNTRIKLQKGLGAMDELVGVVVEKEEGESVEEEKRNSEAIKSAENAALALWSTLEELRIALADAHTKDGAKKRKRQDPITNSTSTTSLWERMSDLESESLLHRRAVLDKWSSKVRGTATSLPNARGKLLGSASGTQKITAVLDAHVGTEIGDRANKRARQTSAANGSTPTGLPEPVYDDTVFYQSLLRDLVEQRMSSSEAMTGGLDTLHQLPSRLPIHPITGMRNDKNRKEVVDTRASKGRKMRFNVHEKLQNFMAPEDRGSWTVRARDEFFASLLGKSASGLLGEGDESASDAESDEDREEGGLRLFRN